MLRIPALIAALFLIGAAPASAQESPATEPRNTPDLPEHLQAIDDILVGGLLNDPTDLNFDLYGNNFGGGLVVDESYPGGGAALRVSMGSSGPIYAGGMNVPLLAPIHDGDIVTVGFFARTIESSVDDGRGRVSVRFQRNSEPYPGFGDTMLEISTEWGWYEVTAVADRSIQHEGIIALQFGRARQTVEIGQTIVVSGTASIVD